MLLIAKHSVLVGTVTLFPTLVIQASILWEKTLIPSTFTLRLLQQPKLCVLCVFIKYPIPCELMATLVFVQALKTKSQLYRDKDTYPAETGQKPSNKKKNRFKDILPCEPPPPPPPPPSLP